MKTLAKTWPILSLLFIPALLAVGFAWPQVSRWLSLASLVLGIGVGIYLAAYPERQRYRTGRTSRPQLAKAIFIKTAGVLLALGSAILAGGWIGRLAGQSAWDADWPEWAVIVAGILAGFAAGFAAGLLVRFLWGKLFEPKRVKTAQAGEGEEFPGSSGGEKSEDCEYPRPCG